MTSQDKHNILSCMAFYVLGLAIAFFVHLVSTNWLEPAGYEGLRKLAGLTISLLLYWPAPLVFGLVLMVIGHLLEKLIEHIDGRIPHSWRRAKIYKPPKDEFKVGLIITGVLFLIPLIVYLIKWLILD